MLQTFLGNLWTMTLIIGCIAIILLFFGIIYATIYGILEIKRQNKISDIALRDLQNNFDDFVKELDKEDKDKKE